MRERYGLSGRDKEQRQNFRALTNLFFRLGMHEGAAAPSYLIRSGGVYAARSGPGGRFLYHFPAVTEGDRKMMQLEKMKIFIFSKGVDFVNTLKTCPLSRRPYLPTVISA